MAIQISGTTVVNDSRQLQNIASIDSTTATSIQNAGVGATTLQTLEDFREVNSTLFVSGSTLTTTAGIGSPQYTGQGSSTSNATIVSVGDWVQGWAAHQSSSTTGTSMTVTVKLNGINIVSRSGIVTDSQNQFTGAYVTQAMVSARSGSVDVWQIQRSANVTMLTNIQLYRDSLYS